MQQARGGALDTALLERSLLPEPALLEALAESAGLRAVNLPDFEPNAEVATLIPANVAERLCVAPLSVDGDTLHVVSAYPVPREEVQEVAFLLGKQLELWVAVEARVRQWIADLHGEIGRAHV